MNKKMAILLMSLLAGFGESFSQQNNLFTGKVVGEENQGLNGAFVYIEELGIGDDTDATGSFRISNVPVGTYDIVVSYVGYKPVTKEIGFQPGVIE
jgi:iron complex outermembrane receptor protein